jgi:ATP-dependent Lon protease
LARIPVHRDLAMTGEITLRGRILPIGGLKEKALAAHRAEIKRILIPKENEKDLAELPKSVLNETEIVLVDHMDEVLRHALVLEDRDAFYNRLRGAVASPIVTTTPPAPSSDGEDETIPPSH